MGERAKIARHFYGGILGLCLTAGLATGLAVGAGAADLRPIPLYNTGIGTNGQLLAEGQSDPHYVLISGSIVGSRIIPVVGAPLVGDTNTLFFTNGLSAWVVGTNSLPGQHAYYTTFDLAGLDASSAHVAGYWKATISTLGVTLNDLSIPSRVIRMDTSAGLYGGSFVIDTGFVPGVNQLQFSYPESDPFQINVQMSGTARVPPPNQPPSFVPGNDVAVAGNSGPARFPEWARSIRPGPDSEASQQVEFVVEISNPGLFAQGPAIDPTGTLTFTPATDTHGRSVVTVRLRDNGGTENGGTDTSSPAEFAITVQPPEYVTTLMGQVTDALTKAPVDNVLISVGNRLALTDADGYYAIERFAGFGGAAAFDAFPRSGSAPLDVQFTNLTAGFSPTLLADHDGYLSYTNATLSLAPGPTNRIDFSLSPQILAGVRFVLNWGALPKDLDAHLLTPEMAGKTYEVYYSPSHRGSLEAIPFALLDVDSRFGYGPETITIGQLWPGTYRYFVANYIDDGRTGYLTNSGASVQIYSDRGLLETVAIPMVGQGDYWDVCTLDGASGAITVNNRIVAGKPTASTVNGPGIVAAAETYPEAVFPHAARDGVIRPSGNGGSAASGSLGFVWAFGDGATSTVANPVYTYPSPGWYTVSLQAVFPDGHVDTVINDQFIVANANPGKFALQITRAGAEVVLSWPAQPDGLVLERTFNLAMGSWLSVSPVPPATNGWFSLPVNPSRMTFFRLRQGP